MITRPDPVSVEEWLSWDVEEDEPPDCCEDDLDPEGSALPWDEDLAAIVAETDQIARERAADATCLGRSGTAELAGAVLANEARKRGQRGPGLTGSVERVPGVSSGPAGGFGAGECLDTAPGSAFLHGLVEKAVDSGARVAPKKAKDRREHGAKNARVERWAEDSGNAGLSIREASPVRVLAADQKITWWGRQLQAAGVEGGMDVLRARAALDLLLNYDSRPAARSRPG